MRQLVLFQVGDEREECAHKNVLDTGFQVMYHECRDCKAVLSAITQSVTNPESSQKGLIPPASAGRLAGGRGGERGGGNQIDVMSMTDEEWDSLLDFWESGMVEGDHHAELSDSDEW